jgi:hypothetical protein
MSRNRILGSPYEQQIASASFQTEPHIDRYCVEATGPLTVTLDPNAFDGDQVVILDAAGNAATNNITLVAGVGSIEGASVININGGSVECTFNFLLSQWTVRTSSSGNFKNFTVFEAVQAPTGTPATTLAFQASAVLVGPSGRLTWTTTIEIDGSANGGTSVAGNELQIQATLGGVTQSGLSVKSELSVTHDICLLALTASVGGLTEGTSVVPGVLITNATNGALTFCANNGVLTGYTS